MPRPRRLVIRMPNGGNWAPSDQVAHIDLTGVPNADSRAPLQAVVQEQCDLQCWHDLPAKILPAWSND